MQITSKQQMRELYQQGAFGNKFPSWPLPEFEQIWGTVDFPVGLMYNGKPGMQLPCYAAPLTSMQKVGIIKFTWIDKYGCDPNLITVSRGDYGLRRAIQGEIQRSERGYDLTFSLVQKTMREALAEQSYFADGLVALGWLQDSMDTPSYENLHSLFDRFPDSVVEFTCYERGVGELGWNTVFWEVRNY